MTLPNQQPDAFDLSTAEAVKLERRKAADAAAYENASTMAHAVVDHAAGVADPDDQASAIFHAVPHFARLPAIEFGLLKLRIQALPGMKKNFAAFNTMLREERNRNAQQDPDARENNPEHTRLIAAIQDHLNGRRLSMNAAGLWSDGRTWRPLPETTTRTIATDFALSYRRQGEVSTDRVVETLDELGNRQRRRRRDDLVRPLLGKPAQEAGRSLVIDWLRAVTGEENTLSLGVMLHWLWLVKRSLAGLPRAHDLMPVIVGGQGGGKSTAVARLCGPLAELAAPISAATLTDERRATELETYFVGIWDELEGIERHDVEALKNAITCQTKPYRPLYTTRTAQAIRIMNFIGTSNRPINMLVRDTTGARRFAELHARATMDWETINGLDYTTLWSAVSESDPTPILIHRDELAEAQRDFRFRDSVTLWLADESWEQMAWSPQAGIEPETVPAYEKGVGDIGPDLRARYVAWCRRQGEATLSGAVFWNRIKEEGVRQHRPWREGKRPERYLRPGDVVL